MRRYRSVIALSLLALVWVGGTVALADPTTPMPLPHMAQQPSESDILRWLLSGSGNAAVLAVVLWGKLTSQDKLIAEIKAANDELKRLISSRPCLYGEDGECDVHGRPHRRRKGDA